MTATNRPSDPTRAYVAIAKLCKALSVPADPDVPDHVLLERLAEAAHNPYSPRTPCSEGVCCPCAGCKSSGDA